MKYKLFISDFDWTLGLAPDKMEKETVDAVKRYVSDGGIFVICTGRSYLSIKKVCEKYGLSGVVVAFQGSLAVDLHSSKEIFNGGIENELAVEIIKDLLAEGIDTGVYIDDLYHYETQGEYIKVYEKLVCVDGVKVDNLLDFTLNTKGKIRKVLSLSEPEIVEQTVRKLSKKYEGKLIVNKSSKNILEVVSPKWSKGQAVRKIAEYFNLPLSQVIAVGDSTNDISLLDGPWHGVAVGDGMEELKKYAKEITVPFNEQPVRELLNKYCIKSK